MWPRLASSSNGFAHVCMIFYKLCYNGLYMLYIHYVNLCYIYVYIYIHIYNITCIIKHLVNTLVFSVSEIHSPICTLVSRETRLTLPASNDVDLSMAKLKATLTLKTWENMIFNTKHDEALCQLNTINIFRIVQNYEQMLDVGNYFRVESWRSRVFSMYHLDLLWAPTNPCCWVIIPDRANLTNDTNDKLGRDGSVADPLRIQRMWPLTKLEGHSWKGAEQAGTIMNYPIIIHI